MVPQNSSTWVTTKQSSQRLLSSNDISLGSQPRQVQPTPIPTHFPCPREVVLSQSRVSSPQTHFCITENAAAALLALFSPEESELRKTKDLKKDGNNLFPPAPSPQVIHCDHTLGNSSCASTCMGEDGSLLWELGWQREQQKSMSGPSLAAPAGAGGLPTTALSTKMTVSKGHLQAH